jgi:putative oxidoreductase
MKFGRLTLRGIIGAIFVGHGTQKLLGWFEGPGIDGASQFFEKLGARPGRLNAIAASSAETGSGLLMLLGLATPVAASAITGVMLTAIKRVHGKNGFWNSSGGYEFNLALIGGALALAEVGPGNPSLDAALDTNMSGPGWALAALVAGALGAAGAHALAASQRETEAVAPPERQPTPPRQGAVRQPAMA